ncbi:MAG: TraR/DksA C4-type zinc finger protein [Actinobacteria bacterium]|nr:TraR/DksA C4-type zinc finger protein [Actinomycetota bacterium]
MTSSNKPLTVRDRRALRTAVQTEIDRLDEQIATLTTSFDDIVEGSELVSTDDEHDPEGTTIAFERSQVTSLLRSATSDRDALRAALDRVDDDDYGACATCGTFIGVERLLALPAATQCVTCAV